MAMNFKLIKPPRTFKVGKKDNSITIKDCAHIKIEPEEQITFETENGAEYDIVRKDWGFYATPSLNSRLTKFGLKAVLIRSQDHKYYIFIVEKGKEDSFQAYLNSEGHKIVSWMDRDDILKQIEDKINL